MQRRRRRPALLAAFSCAHDDLGLGVEAAADALAPAKRTRPHDEGRRSLALRPPRILLRAMAPHVRWADRDDTAFVEGEDHFVHLHCVSWTDYERVLAIRGDHSAPRIQYLEGELEIMSPGRNHETLKEWIASLVDVWCDEHGVEFSKLGSWTLKKRKDQRGAEPDGCYVFGDSPKRATKPDLAIEVVWTSGGIDKLEIYRKLGVREVWYWRKGKITPYELRGERYKAIRASKVLRGIDLAQLASFLDRPCLITSARIPSDSFFAHCAKSDMNAAISLKRPRIAPRSRLATARAKRVASSSKRRAVSLAFSFDVRMSA
jgi:Uma2 family endonuclease